MGTFLLPFDRLKFILRLEQRRLVTILLLPMLACLLRSLGETLVILPVFDFSVAILYRGV